MAIAVQDLITAMLAQIGAEGTQRYTVDQDLIPAANGASRLFQAFMGATLAEKKGSEEAFRELTRTVIYQTNAFGGFILDDTQNRDTIWTVLALYGEPEFTQFSPPPLVLAPSQSAFRGDLTFAGSSKPVERITVEEAAFRRRSLKRGSERLANTDVRGYAYYWVGDRGTIFPDVTWPTAGQAEIMVIPVSLMDHAFIAVTYLRTAPVILADTDIMPYPSSMFNLLRDLALNELTPKQGDGTTLNGLTAQQIAQLLNLQS